MNFQSRKKEREENKNSTEEKMNAVLKLLFDNKTTKRQAAETGHTSNAQTKEILIIYLKVFKNTTWIELRVLTSTCLLFNIINHLSREIY